MENWTFDALEYVSSQIGNHFDKFMNFYQQNKFDFEEKLKCKQLL